MAELDAQIGLTADASGVEAGVGRAKKSLASLGASATKMGQDVAGAGDKAGKAISSVGDGGEKSAKKIERDTKSMQGSLQRYIATLEAGSKDSRKYWEQMADFKGVDKTALRPLLDQLDAYKIKAREASGASEGLGLSFSSLRAAAGVAIGGAVVQSAVAATKALYEASVQAERLRIMLDFSTARGSASEIAYLRTITNDLGLAFSSTATAYSQFQAAARGTALEGKKSRDVFESIAKASAVMGLSAEQSSGVLLALQQMISKGTVQAEELRGQLGERLPGAFQIAAKAMGVTTAELGKMLEQGQVVADDFLPKFAKALNESLGGAAEKAADRLDAAVNRFGNAWERLKQNAGDSGFSQFWAGQINILTDGMNDVSNSMDMARLSGSGFIGQMKAGAGAVLAFANPLNAFSYSARDLGVKLRDAEKELEALKQAGAERSSNLMLREAFAHAQRLVDKYREAKAAQNALLGVEAEQDPRDQSGFKPRSASYQDYARQQADSEKALADVRMRAAGINKQYFADLKTYQDALRLGTMTEKQYTAAVAELATTTWKASTAGKDAEKGLTSGASEAKKAATEYQRLIDSIHAKIAAEELELAGGEKLTESQRLRVKFAQELQTSLKGLSAAKVAEYTASLDALDALEKEGAARKEFLQIAEQERQQRVKFAQAAEQSVASLITGNQQLREEIQLIGLSAAEQMEVIRLREEAVLLVQEQHLAEMARAEDVTGTMTRERIALEQEIKLRRERLDLMGQKVKREAVVASNREIAQEWQRTADDINRALTDSLLRGFESGKDFAATLRDTVVNMFKTMVLRPIVSAIVMPVAGAITGALGLAGSASAGQGGVLSTMGSAGGILSGVSAMGGSLAAGAGWLTGATTLGGALGAGGSLVAAGGAGVLPGMGMIAGAIGPIAIGLGALSALASSLDKSGTPHYGAASQYSGGKASGDEALFKSPGASGRYSSNNQKAMDQVALGFGSLLDETAKTFGKEAGYSLFTAYSDDSSDDPGFGALRIERDGKKVIDWEDQRTSKWGAKIFEDGEEGWNLYLAAIAKDTRQVLMDMDLPSWADKMLSDLGDDVTVEQLSGVVQQIGVINTAFEQLGNNMSMFAGITDELQGALLEAAGGIDALVNSAGAFYQGFYSEAERMESMRDQLNAALSGLNLSIDPNLGDDAKAQFRAAVESAMAAGNAELAAALLAISGNFASAADYFEQLSKTAAEAAAAAAKTAAEDADRARKEQINSVHDLFRRAVERDRSNLSDQASALGDVINSISSAVDLLKSNARDLYGEVDSTQQMLAAQGMVYIEDALAGVRAGASVADYTGLSDAISAARGGLSSGAYASEFDRQRDTLVLAGQLSDLAEAGGEQLSVQERQLRGINAQIDYLDTLAKRADDMVNGTAALTGTVESYFGQLMSLLGVKGTPSAPSGYGGVQDGGVQGGTAARPWQYGQGYAGEPTRFGVEYDFGAGLGGRGWHDVTDREQIAKLTGLRAMLQAEYGSGSAEDLARVADKAKAMGATMGDIASALGFWREDIVQMFAGVGIPAFAVGTNYVPRDMVAKIHEGEAIVPKAFNPWAGGGGMQINTARLEALVEKLTEENQRQAGEIVRLNLRVAKVLERWDGDGMPTAREEAKA